MSNPQASPQKKKPTAQQVLSSINGLNTDRLTSLLDDGADPNATVNFTNQRNSSLLRAAAGCQFLEGVRILIQAGADPNQQGICEPDEVPGSTALHSAIYCSGKQSGDDADATRIAIVDMLLAAGADPNLPFNGDGLALSTAASKADMILCQRLVAAGARVTDITTASTPPLHGSAMGALIDENKAEAIALFLLELGAPIEAATPEGHTPLMAAAVVGSKRLVELFLSRGAKAAHQASNGKTPLHQAAQRVAWFRTPKEHEEGVNLLKCLVEAGGDPMAKTSEGETPYDVLKQGHNDPTKAYLQGITAI